MDLSKYNGKHVRITDKWNETFTGMAEYANADFLEKVEFSLSPLLKRSKFCFHWRAHIQAETAFPCVHTSFLSELIPDCPCSYQS